MSLVVPERYALAEAGMTCDGVHALDFWLGVDPADGSVVLRAADVERRAKLELNVASFADWVGERLFDGIDVTGYGDALEMLVEDLEPLARAADRRTLLDVAFPGLPEGMQRLYLAMNEYLYLRDPDYVTAVLAAAAAKPVPEDPLWLMLVMVSSSGKNEAQRLLAAVRDATLKNVTLAGLLGKGDKGLLPRLGNGCDALVTIADFSALLGDDRRSGAEVTDVYNALRDVYDGEYEREIHPQQLSWRGRVSLIASCTPAIDRFSKHADSLGTRWLYFRGAERDLQTRREMASMATLRENLPAKRLAARDLATPLVRDAQARVLSVTLPEYFERMIVDAATLVGYGRASVPRTWSGDEVDDIVEPEEPGRVAGQLRSLARGCLALGVSEEVARRIVMRAAWSSMPQARARVLAVLAGADEPLSTSAVQHAAGMEFRPAKRALEDWQAIGMVASAREEGAGTTAPFLWSLAGEDAAFVRSTATAVTDSLELR